MIEIADSDEEGDPEDQVDQKRLTEIKSELFNTHRQNAKEMVHVPSLIDIFKSIVAQKTIDNITEPDVTQASQRGEGQHRLTFANILLY